MIWRGSEDVVLVWSDVAEVRGGAAVAGLAGWWINFHAVHVMQGV